VLHSSNVWRLRATGEVDLRRLEWSASTDVFSDEGCSLERWKDLYVIYLFQGVCWLRVGSVSVILLFHLFNGVPLHKKRDGSVFSLHS
jgi:hypothetical protein